MFLFKIFLLEEKYYQSLLLQTTLLIFIEENGKNDAGAEWKKNQLHLCFSNLNMH